MILTLAPMLFGADSVQCPPRIEVNQQLVIQPPGWSVISDEMPHQLAGLTFFDGNPRDKASLAPDKQTPVNGKTVALWTFGVSRGPIWIACRYASTDRVLARQLPGTIRTCSITYATRETIDGLPVIEKIDCK
ncbi:MAG: STY0301 family protein [Bryobacteraceae bacterium]|jgi:hypothetical protein